MATTKTTKAAHHMTAAERRAYDTFRKQRTQSAALYRDEHHDHKANAQRNLSGRTHYVDDQTLKAFGARILRTGVSDNGLTFWLLESVKRYDGRRVYRPAVFDIFGSNIAGYSAQPHVDDIAAGYSTRTQAERALWEILNAHDAATHTATEVSRRLAQAKEDARADLAILRPLMRAEARQRKLEADAEAMQLAAEKAKADGV